MSLSRIVRSDQSLMGLGSAKRLRKLPISVNLPFSCRHKQISANSDELTRGYKNKGKAPFLAQNQRLQAENKDFYNEAEGTQALNLWIDSSMVIA